MSGTGAVIFTEGSETIGFGHITRCTAIQQALEELGVRTLLVVNGDASVRDICSGTNHIEMNWLKCRGKALEMSRQSAVTIIDSYLASEDFYAAISAISRVPVYVDDYRRIEYPSGTLLNGNVYGADMDYPAGREDRKYLLGSKYTPLRKDFWDVPRKDIREKVEKVMITTGGNDDLDLSPGILDMLSSDFPEVKKYMLIGRAYGNVDRIEMAADLSTELVFGADSSRMKEMMMDSDIAISAGGQTLNELARIGVPTIGILFSGNQKDNLECWSGKGFLQYVEEKESGAITMDVSEKLKMLSGREQRVLSSGAGSNLLDGQGARRIAEILTEGNV